MAFDKNQYEFTQSRAFEPPKLCAHTIELILFKYEATVITMSGRKIKSFSF